MHRDAASGALLALAKAELAVTRRSASSATEELASRKQRKRVKAEAPIVLSSLLLGTA